MYRIKVNYDTGDSFKTEHDLEDYLPYEWDDIEVAKRVLADIKEHYEYYCKVHSYDATPDSNKDINEEVKTKRWYHNYGKWSDGWHYTISVENNEGERINISTGIWCGYFETLNSAEIVDKSLRFDV